MARLTVKQRQFIERHGLDPDLHALDATGMTRAQFRRELSRERRLIVYGLAPCPRGHTLRTAGGCPQCDTSYIAYAKRSRLPGYVYIAKSGHLTKVGFSQGAPNRIYIANVEGYAGEQNWRIRACLNLRYGRGNNHVWTPQASAPRDRYLTREEVDRLLEHVRTPHVRLFIILAITTGARMSALLDLRWNQVDFKHRTINFNQVGREQTNKRRPEVPLNTRAFEALEEAARAALTD